MKTKTLTTGAIVLIALIVGGIYLYYLLNPPECDQDIFTRNKLVEDSIRQSIAPLLPEGVTIEELEAINLAFKEQIYVKLHCEEEVDLKTEEKLIEDIANRVFKEYPDTFSENATRDSWIDIEGCSQMGTSPDGVNTYYHSTRWTISHGYYDVQI